MWLVKILIGVLILMLVGFFLGNRNRVAVAMSRKGIRPGRIYHSEEGSRDAFRQAIDAARASDKEK